MAITKETITHLAALARIKVSESERAALAKDVEAVLSYVSEITNVSADIPHDAVGEHYNVLREDAESHEPGIHTEALLSQVPQRKNDYVKVKKIL